MSDSLPIASSASDRRSFFGLRPEKLAELVISWGQPRYRADQVLAWAYSGRAGSFDEMANVPKVLRARLASELFLYESRIALEQESCDGTVKLLLRWPDGATSECVLIPDGERRTACVSSQVGCPVGCVFCASGLGGLQRQLSAAQIVEQAMRVRTIARSSVLCNDEGTRGTGPLSPDATAATGGGRYKKTADATTSDCNETPNGASGGGLSNVVFMGLGEPLANYDATLHAVRTINADWGLGIGARRITVSTVGLPEQMRRLAEERLQVTLAISLHAPNDELRRRIIPWAQRVSIESLTEAANHYFARTGREVTLEYILLGGVNDAPQHAYQLARVSQRMRSNVNLIIYNPVEGLAYDRPAEADVERFQALLCDRGVNVHLRRSRGLDIDAACGQLRRRDAT